MSLKSRINTKRHATSDRARFRRIINDTMRLTGCTYHTAHHRLTLCMQSKVLAAIDDPASIHYQFVVDQYMTGRVGSDERLLEMIERARKDNTPPDPSQPML